MADDTQQPTDAEQLASDFKKDELQTAAQVVGADVPSGATKADLAEAIVSQASVAPVAVTNFTRRSGAEALLGHFVDIVKGEFAGRFGHYFADVSHKPDGYPDRVQVRTRDSDNLVVEVGHDEIRPSERAGGR